MIACLSHGRATILLTCERAFVCAGFDGMYLYLQCGQPCSLLTCRMSYIFGGFHNDALHDGHGPVRTTLQETIFVVECKVRKFLELFGLVVANSLN